MATLQPAKGTCYICERGGVTLQRIGPTSFRHEDCAPGSVLWLEWYERLPENRRTEEGNILFSYYNKKRRSTIL